MKNWSSEFHALLLSLSGVLNDPNVDSSLVGQAGVPLHGPLLPLLSWIGMLGPMGTVQLADMVGRDHSTVSRQVSKLVEANLVVRVVTADGRLRLLKTTEEGRAVLSKLDKTRHILFEKHFRDWSPEDRHQLTSLLKRFLTGIYDLFPVDARSPHAVSRPVRRRSPSSRKTPTLIPHKRNRPSAL